MCVVQVWGCLAAGLSILAVMGFIQLAPRQAPGFISWGIQPCHPQLPLPFCFSKSQSLTNSLSTSDTSQRGTPSEDEAKAETIRNLRKSFASLFSD